MAIITSELISLPAPFKPVTIQINVTFENKDEIYDWHQEGQNFSTDYSDVLSEVYESVSKTLNESL